MQEYLQKIKQTIHSLLAELKAGYAAASAYQVLERIFTENLHLQEDIVQAKENQEFTSDSLQSVDDL